MANLALGDCRSVGEALDRIAEAAAGMRDARSDGWLIVAGVRTHAWTDPRWPTMRELDRACPDRPCFVRSFDYHSCAVNTAAFAAAGFSPASADPPGGVVVRGSDGRPTGVLLEAAYQRAREAVPEPSRDEWKSFVRSGLADLAGHGFVEVHDLLAQDWLGGVLAELCDEGGLPARVRLYVPWERVEAERAASDSYARPGRVEFAGGKAFADGTLNSRTAWMLAPYRDPLPGYEHGTGLMDAGALHHAMRRCAAVGAGLAVHAIGDAAVRATLDAAQAAIRRGDACPVRIEHAEVIDRLDVPRFAELGVVASVQPCHLLYDGEALRRHLPHRLDRVLPLRELIGAGLAPGAGLVFGSDAPIVRPDPDDSVLAAVQRGRHDPIAPEQALHEREAWGAFGVLGSPQAPGGIN